MGGIWHTLDKTPYVVTLNLKSWCNVGKLFWKMQLTAICVFNLVLLLCMHHDIKSNSSYVSTYLVINLFLILISDSDSSELSPFSWLFWYYKRQTYLMVYALSLLLKPLTTAAFICDKSTVAYFTCTTPNSSLEAVWSGECCSNNWPVDKLFIFSAHCPIRISPVNIAITLFELPLFKEPESSYPFHVCTQIPPRGAKRISRAGKYQTNIALIHNRANRLLC